jgi:hypothetical protein
MSEVRHQLLITTVHGTWGRGFFAGQRQNRRPWFGEDSSFLDRLIEELGDIPHKITPLLWSGANSIFVRDKTAHVLAEHLAAEHIQHPLATQLVIAHSHGGNIALRALYLLRKRDASRSCGAKLPTPLVVTLATPFIEVQPADLGFRPSVIRFLTLYALAYFVLLLIWGIPRLNEFSTYVLKVTVGSADPRVLPLLDGSHTTVFIAALIALPFIILGYLWWDLGRTSARQRHIDDLNDATRLGEVVSAQAERLLIVRAIDDEASLTLALGTILVYGTTAIIAGIGTTLAFVFIHVQSISNLVIPALGWKVIALAADIIAALTLLLFGIFALARAVHGCELSWSPMECRISTHSTPDAIGLSKIVTLVQRTYETSLRHGIYGHEDCVKVISDWVHSRLCTMPAT